MRTCAGTRSDSEAEGIYVADLGRTTAGALAEHVPRILNKYRYDMYRAEQKGDYIHYETEWRWRTPLPDEWALGYLDANTRIIIEGQESGIPLWEQRRYGVRFRAENRLGRAADAPWEEPALTEMRYSGLCPSTCFARSSRCSSSSRCGTPSVHHSGAGSPVR